MGEMSGRFEILPDPVALARRVAEWMTLAALAAKGTFRVSLSGGSTPKTLYRLLASDEFSGRFPWQRGCRSQLPDHEGAHRRHAGIESTRDEPGGGFIRVNLRPPLRTSPTK